MIHEGVAILNIHGLSEAGRAERLERAARKLDGVLRVDINYVHDRLTIRYDSEKLTLAHIKKTLDLVNLKPG